MSAYPITLEHDGNSYAVFFTDIPEAITQGETLEQALEMAQDALVTAMDFYFEDKRAVPLPSAMQEGQYGVTLPPSIWAKVLLLNAVCEQGIRPSEMARKMGARPQEVNRLFNLHQATKIDTIAKAMQALGKRLVLSFE